MILSVALIVAFQRTFTILYIGAHYTATIYVQFPLLT